MKNNINKKRFIVFDNAQLEVSNVDYFNHYRPIWRLQSQMRKAGQCICPSNLLWTCSGICPDCQYHRAGNTLSLDVLLPSNDGNNKHLTLLETIADDQRPTPDEILIHRELMLALRQALASLSEDERQMCILMSQMSERQAAQQLGMPRSTFKRNWTKIRTKLQLILKEYYF